MWEPVDENALYQALSGPGGGLFPVVPSCARKRASENPRDGLPVPVVHKGLRFKRSPCWVGRRVPSRRPQQRRSSHVVYDKRETSDFLLDPLRKEPRFQAIERELKFPD